MDIELLPLASFIFVTIYTPGPNNLSSASMGICYGYKRTLSYLLGIASGFYIVMMLSGWLSTYLIKNFPSLEQALRIIGALYILWLAWQTLQASYTSEVQDIPQFGFLKGFFLQILNLKVIFFGLTLYNSFLVNKIDTLLGLFISALIFSIFSFSSTSLWALFGAAIRKYLTKPRVTQVINIALALLLVLAAIDLSNILKWFK